MEKQKNNFPVWVITILSFVIGLVSSTFIMGQRWGVLQADMVQIKSAIAAESEANANAHPIVYRTNTELQYLKDSVKEIKSDIKTILSEIRNGRLETR